MACSLYIDWVCLREYSPADYAEECAGLHYCAEIIAWDYCGVVVVLGGRLRLSAWSAGDFWVSSVQIDWVLLHVILPQIAQITQTNAAKLHYFAEKDRLVWLMCFAGSWGLLFGVCLRKSARSAGDMGGSFVRIDWVRLRVILSQIAQITQRNAAKLYYFAEKDRLVRFAGFSFWGLMFWGLSA